MTLTVGSLFSGIGGLDLGLERAGMRVIWQSEIDNYASRVLHKHWPEVPNYGDIKQIDWASVPRPDVICGGYPCQPFSIAGQRKGEEDPRHLWPWVRDAISGLRPKYAILENVRGHLSMGGLTVIGELAAIGYNAEWRIVSAASVGANHRRDRLFIVAYPDGQDEPACSKHEVRLVADSDSGGMEGSRTELQAARTSGDGQEMADSAGEGLQGNIRTFKEKRAANVSAWSGWEWWQTEPDVGRVAHGVPSRVDRLKGLGNAVVPQVAEVIGRLVIEHHERSLQ